MENKTITVMVVEDEELLLKAITKKLEIDGKKVIACMSGKQAIDCMNNLGQLPDAIWLDYYLKDMTGLRFMVALKENSAWTNIPVMVVSNSATQDRVSEMLALGAKKYVLKAESRLDDLMGVVDEITSGNGGGKS
jgi:CheY-like chemotaxis protein